MKIIWIITICLIIVATIIIIWGALTKWKFICKKKDNYQEPSRYVGVYQSKNRKWAARMYHDNTMHDLGTHDSEEAAARAYTAAISEIDEIPILIYYHIAEIGEWKDIVKEQLDLLKSSGLYDKCQEVRVVFLGNKHNIMKFIKDKVKLVYHSTNIKEYEHPTLNSLLQFSQQCPKEHYILYIHNKGSTGKICNNINGQFYWRQLMNYWLIEQYQKCIDYLNKSYLTCGINASLVNLPHYSGNFWWSTTEYIKNLSPISDPNDRLLAESWLLNRNNLVKNKNISLYGPYIISNEADCSGLYGMKLDRNDYTNEDIKIF